MSENCMTCRFFRDHNGSGGACHRFPPQVSVAHLDWCGEWKAPTVDGVVAPSRVEILERRQGLLVRALKAEFKGWGQGEFEQLWDAAAAPISEA